MNDGTTDNQRAMRSASDGPVPRKAALALRLVGEVAAMIRFYSRLPLGRIGAFDDPADPPPFGRACRMLPIASLVIAMPAAATLLVLGASALPSFAIATAVAGIALLSTGALHEDGLADMADGFGGGSDRATKLRIMKDSQIGSYGAAALILMLIARVSLIAALIDRSPLSAATGLVAGAILSRTLSLGVFAALPPARADGVASSVGGPSTQALAIAVGLTVALLFLIAGPWLGLARVFVGLTVAIVATTGIARLARAQIGGQTGDVLGAVQVLAEIGFLAGLSAL